MAKEEEIKEGSPTKADEEQARQNKLILIEERKQLRERKRKTLELRKQEILDKDPARKGWHFFSHAELSERREHLPPVSFALRHPVKDLYLQMDYFKELLDQAQAVVQEDRDSRYTEISDHGFTCSESGKPIVGCSRYYASYMATDVLKEIHLSEQAFNEPTEIDYLPLVYFRVTHPLKEGQNLPLVDISRLFKKEEIFNFKLSMKTSKTFFGNRQQVIDLFKDQEADVFKKCFLNLLKTSETGFEKHVRQCFLEVNENKVPTFERDFWEQKKEVLRFVKDGKSDDLSDDFKALLGGLRKVVTEENFAQVHLALFKDAFFQRVAMKVLSRVSERPLKNCLPDSLPHLRKTSIASLPAYMKQEIMRTMISNLPTYDT